MSCKQRGLLYVRGRVSCQDKVVGAGVASAEWQYVKLRDCCWRNEMEWSQEKVPHRKYKMKQGERL